MGVVTRRVMAILISVGSLFLAGSGAAGDRLGVRTLMEDVEKYPGRIEVVGVVSRLYPDREMLALIDLEEFRECRVVTCAKLTLPVRWRGGMPEVASTVQVTGEVQKDGMRKVFVAHALERVE